MAVVWAAVETIARGPVTSPPPSGPAAPGREPKAESPRRAMLPGPAPQPRCPHWGLPEPNWENRLESPAEG